MYIIHTYIHIHTYRYRTHTAKCTSCSTALSIYTKQTQALKVLASVSFLFACACVGTLSLPGSLAAFFQILVVFWSVKKRDTILEEIKKFYFVDYVHAEKE